MFGPVIVRFLLMMLGLLVWVAPTVAQEQHICVQAIPKGYVVVHGVWYDHGQWFVKYSNPPFNSTTVINVSPSTYEVGAHGSKWGPG